MERVRLYAGYRRLIELSRDSSSSVPCLQISPPKIPVVGALRGGRSYLLRRPACRAGLVEEGVYPGV